MHVSSDAVGHLYDLFDRLNRADFIVSEHHRNQSDILCEEFLQRIEANPAGVVHRAQIDLVPSTAEIGNHLDDRGVLDRGGDDPVSF